MAKYNRALDTLVMAAALHRQGKSNEAAKLFVQAASDKSMAEASKLVNLYNQKALASNIATRVAKATTAKPATKPAKPTKAAAWPWSETADAAPSDVLDVQNEDFGIEPEENELMTRVVQEADAIDGDEDEHEDEGEEQEAVAAARFTRALANLSRQG